MRSNPNNNSEDTKKNKKKGKSFFNFFGKKDPSAALVNYLDRPENVKAAIMAQYAALINAPKTGYTYIGQPNYTFSICGFKIATDEIFKKMIAEKKDSLPLVVLDLGAGNFLFTQTTERKFGDKVIPFGITADKRYLSKSVTPSEIYLFGNAELLTEYCKQAQFDFIFSARTFFHFVDPVSALQEAYKTLKPGGTIMVSEFQIHGCQMIMPDIMDYLIATGYNLVYAFDPDANTTLFLQKTEDKPELIMPLVYKGFDDKGKATYAPTADVPFIQAKMQQNYFDLGKAKVTELIKKMGEDPKKKNLILPLITDCKSFQELFTHPNYARSDSETQNWVIVQVGLSLMEKDNVLPKLSKSANDILLRACASNDLDVLFELQGLLNRANPDEFENIMKHAIVIISERLGRSDGIAAGLNKMGLPYSSPSLKSIYFPTLQFPEFAKLTKPSTIQPKLM